MRILFLFFLLIALNACASSFIAENMSPDILYRQAKAELAKGRIDKSIGIIRKLESNYIFTSQAIDGQAMLIWLYYQKNDLAEAESTANNFLKYYPFNQYTPWVEYMLAIITYESMPYYKKNIIEAVNALNLFNSFISRYPNTDYAKDLQFKKELIRSLLAYKVMQIGNYYLSHKSYIGAINRFNEIVNVYGNTIFAPEALYKLEVAYLSAGLDQEAINSFKLLKYNYNNTRWYKVANDLLSNEIRDTNNKE